MGFINRIRPIGVLVSLCLVFISFSHSAFALQQDQYVYSTKKSGAFELVVDAKAAAVVVSSDDLFSAQRAAENLVQDISRVSGITPQLVHSLDGLQGDIVVAGTIGHSELIQDLIDRKKLTVDGVEGHWDAFSLKVVEKPWPKIDRALVIIGANRRATAYGVYDLSEQIGVSPWYYWADVPARKSKSLYVDGKLDKTEAPKVKYRGIFLNDEAPALSSWVAQNHGIYNHEFYVKVFELLLRLKANFLWPAMWNNAFADDDPQNMILAHEYGIVMSTSHHEPMMRADKEWNRYGEGAWEYSTNPENLYKFWEDGARRNKEYESIYTLGMRGQEDKPMSEGENIELLEKIVDDQREIIAKVFGDDKVSEVPQVWCLYKEVQAYYEKGMRVPDDVILLWSDDNWGNIRRLPTESERERQGGAGVYYHFDYVGGPRSYRWINTVPLAKIWEQMNFAYEYGANQIWITNVGDLKPMEYPIEFFLSMAWDPEAWPKEKIDDYSRLWAEREFGKQYADDIAALMTAYTRHNGRRKPELMAPDTYSLLHYSEARRIESELEAMIAKAEHIYRKLPEESKAAYFQLVLFPVKASATVSLLNIAVGQNRLHATQGRADTNILADKAKALFAQDAELEQQYHSLNNGKWQHFANQPHIGYTNWNNPEGDQMPVTFEYNPGKYAEMGIALEGIEVGWPAKVSGSWPHKGAFELSFDQNGQAQREITLYNRGSKAYKFTAKAEQDWIKLSQTEGDVKVEQKLTVSIDWKKAPEGEHKGDIFIKGTGWQGAHIDVHLFKPERKLQRKARGFLEADGYISIEAQHFDRSKKAGDVSWQIIPEHGRTLSSIAPYPLHKARFDTVEEAPYVEYDVSFFSTGDFELSTIVAPSWPVTPGEGLRYAVAIGDDAPVIVDVLDGFAGTDENWDKTVEDGVRIGISQHRIEQAGRYKIRLYALDPGIVVQKLIVNTGGLLPSYLGPPESPRK